MSRSVFGLVLALALSGCSAESPVPSTPAVRPAEPASATPAPPPPTPVPAAPPYVYEAKGRRDPFRPLIAPRVVPVRSRPRSGLAALEVNELKLVGIVSEQRGFYALVEAPNGAGYVLRANDMIGEDARVSRITADAVTFEVAGASPVPQSRVRLVELRLRKEE